MSTGWRGVSQLFDLQDELSPQLLVPGQVLGSSKELGGFATTASSKEHRRCLGKLHGVPRVEPLERRRDLCLHASTASSRLPTAWTLFRMGLDPELQLLVPVALFAPAESESLSTVHAAHFPIKVREVWRVVAERLEPRTSNQCSCRSQAFPAGPLELSLSCRLGRPTRTRPPGGCPMRMNDGFVAEQVAHVALLAAARTPGSARALRFRWWHGSAPFQESRRLVDRLGALAARRSWHRWGGMSQSEGLDDLVRRRPPPRYSARTPVAVQRAPARAQRHADGPEVGNPCTSRRRRQLRPPPPLRAGQTA